MSAYLGFAADLSRAEAQMLALAKQWGDDWQAGTAVVATLDRRAVDHLAAEYLVQRLRDRKGDAYRKSLPQHIERAYTERARQPGERAQVLMEVMGVTAKQVKEWAVGMGILDQVRRGRVSIEIVEAYGIAHTPKDEPLAEELAG